MRASIPERVHDWLDRHAAPEGGLALACSGGGDSHALLLMASAWARSRGRALHVFTVDHGLRPEARAEAQRVAGRAAELGHAGEVLSWTGPKPDSGVQAAARDARHRLLAAACRKAGLADLMLAHTQDDQTETVWMRLAAGGGWRGCAGMAPAGPSPVWPGGRGLRLLRPLLETSRADLRNWLRERGEDWVEDPSNSDRRHARIRIREAMRGYRAAGFDPSRFARLAGEIRHLVEAEGRAALNLARGTVVVHGWGGAELDAPALQAARPAIRRRLLEALMLAVSGQERLPGAHAIDRIEGALSGRRTATAGGVLLTASGGKAWLVRDPGAVLGRVDRPAPPALAGDVWDGRFAIAPLPDGWHAEPLGRSYDGLDCRAILDGVPGIARSGLLALRRKGEIAALPGLTDADRSEVTITPLLEHRFCTRLVPGGAPPWFDTK